MKFLDNLIFSIALRLDTRYNPSMTLSNQPIRRGRTETSTATTPSDMGAPEETGLDTSEAGESWPFVFLGWHFLIDFPDGIADNGKIALL